MEVHVKHQTLGKYSSRIGRSGLLLLILFLVLGSKPGSHVHRQMFPAAPHHQQELCDSSDHLKPFEMNHSFFPLLAPLLFSSMSFIRYSYPFPAQRLSGSVCSSLPSFHFYTLLSPAYLAIAGSQIAPKLVKHFLAI